MPPYRIKRFLSPSLRVPCNRLCLNDLFRNFSSRAKRISAAAFACFGLALLTGCFSAPKRPSDFELETLRLEHQLGALSGQVDPREAEKLGAASMEQAFSLAREYRVVRPPWLHNVLVNNGLRQRGLCFEWTNDLFARLYPLDCRTLDLHLAVARMDTRREHNALLVTARGAPFESGIILDAWRSSGRLWFGPVAGDKYPWVPLPADRVDPALQKLMDVHPAERFPAAPNALTPDPDSKQPSGL